VPGSGRSKCFSPDEDRRDPHLVALLQRLVDDRAPLLRVERSLAGHQATGSLGGFPSKEAAGELQTYILVRQATRVPDHQAKNLIVASAASSATAIAPMRIVMSRNRQLNRVLDLRNIALGATD
jgi:hypothetical protein